MCVTHVVDWHSVYKLHDNAIEYTGSGTRTVRISTVILIVKYRHDFGHP